MAETFDPFDPKNLELSPELAATLATHRRNGFRLGSPVCGRRAGLGS